MTITEAFKSLTIAHMDADPTLTVEQASKNVIALMIAERPHLAAQLFAAMSA